MLRLIFLLVTLHCLIYHATWAQSRRRTVLPEPTNGPIPVVTAPQTRLLESMTFHSSLLNRTVRYSIYLPPDYYTSNRRYPVTFLLHGMGDNETDWIQFGTVDHTMDEGIRTNDLSAMIVVMPDGGTSWYMNDFQNKARYEDMFVQELIPFIDSTYRTRAKRDFRAIVGYSMGGHGALLLAMHHPDLFRSCAALSASVRTDEMIATMPDDQFGRRFSSILDTTLKGNNRITVHWKRNSVLTLARSAPESDLKQVRWYLDCGDDDALTEGNALLHLALLQRGISHEYRARNGSHTWDYWRTGLPNILKFIAAGYLY